MPLSRIVLEAFAQRYVMCCHFELVSPAQSLDMMGWNPDLKTGHPKVYITLLHHLVNHRPGVLLRDGSGEAGEDLLQRETAPWVQTAARPTPLPCSSAPQHLLGHDNPKVGVPWTLFTNHSHVSKLSLQDLTRTFHPPVRSQPRGTEVVPRRLLATNCHHQPVPRPAGGR